VTIRCKHWGDCGITGGGCCEIKAYDRPSFGVCLHICTKYEGPPRQQQIQALANPDNPHSRGCCGNDADVLHWLGLRWYGLPYPKRLYHWIVDSDHPSPRRLRGAS